VGERVSAVDAAGELPLSANVSLLFRDAPYLERFGRARSAGFLAAETWWPWAHPVPTQTEADELVTAIESAGVQLTGLNLFAGDMPGGERGVVAHPDRTDEFAANLSAVVDLARRTGCRAFNALYGQRRDGFTAQEQDEVAIQNLTAAVRALGAIGGTVLIEPLGKGLNGAYPLSTAAAAVRVVESVKEASGCDNIGLLFDTFHLMTSEEDLLSVIEEFAPAIAHVQLADAPGRGEPGTARLDGATLGGLVNRLWDRGYRGYLACEYAPTAMTELTLGWLSGLERVAPLQTGQPAGA
jgi:hydroxypyruvate isomerase